MRTKLEKSSIRKIRQ